jgi:predicted nucleotidyltransferase
LVSQSVVEAVKHYLRRLLENGFDIHFAVIFGSQTTGQAGPWSDIDLIVVSPKFDGDLKRQDLDLLWRLAAHTDSRIEPIPCGEHQWLEDDSSAILEIARREGQIVKVSD